MPEVDSDLVRRIKRETVNIRRRIIEMVTLSRTSHVGSALSIVEILAVLYLHTLRVDTSNPRREDRDRLIFSKGHAGAALYATLVSRGFIDADLLKTFCVEGGRLLGHVTNNVPGIEVSTGSLGHGLSVGVGMAFAARFDRSSHRTFVILSDGECDEGTVWEAAMFAGHHELDNLIAIIDYNGIQSFGRVEEVLDLEPFADKWRAFGWAARDVDGHNVEEIITTLERIPFERSRPSAVIAHTIKGKGISFMENQLAWHYKSPDAEQFRIALEELDRYEKSIL